MVSGRITSMADDNSSLECFCIASPQEGSIQNLMEQVGDYIEWEEKFCWINLDKEYLLEKKRLAWVWVPVQKVTLVPTFILVRKGSRVTLRYLHKANKFWVNQCQFLTFWFKCQFLSFWFKPDLHFNTWPLSDLPPSLSLPSIKNLVVGGLTKYWCSGQGPFF